MVGIYKISSPSNALYIGQSRDIHKRFIHYKNLHCSDQFRIYNSLKKYSPATHIFSVVHELPKDVSKEVLTTYEQLYMDFYRDCGVVLMNLREAGDSGKFSKESSQRRSAIQKGKVVSDAAKNKMSIAKKGKPNLKLRGKKHTKEFCERISLRQKISLSIPENNPFFGKKHSPESLKKMSESSKGKYTAWNKGKTGVYSEDALKKMSEFAKQRKHSEASKAKILDSRKWYKHSDETKERMRQAAFGKKRSEETLRKIAETKAINKLNKLNNQMNT